MMAAPRVVLRLHDLRTPRGEQARLLEDGVVHADLPRRAAARRRRCPRSRGVTGPSPGPGPGSTRLTRAEVAAGVGSLGVDGLRQRVTVPRNISFFPRWPASALRMVSSISAAIRLKLSAQLADLRARAQAHPHRKFPAAKAREAAARRFRGVDSVPARATAARMVPRRTRPPPRNSVLCTMEETGRYTLLLARRRPGWPTPPPSPGTSPGKRRGGPAAAARREWSADHAAGRGSEVLHQGDVGRDRSPFLRPRCRCWRTASPCDPRPRCDAPRSNARPRRPRRSADPRSPTGHRGTTRPHHRRRQDQRRPRRSPSMSTGVDAGRAGTSVPVVGDRFGGLAQPAGTAAAGSEARAGSTGCPPSCPLRSE